MNTSTFNDAHDLISEQYDGRFPGILNLAADFVLRHRATRGFAPDEEVAEDAFFEGFGEEEIAAALMMERGEYMPPRDPRGVRIGQK